jgi:non-specific serine/threonine protein kinase
VSELPYGSKDAAENLLQMAARAGAGRILVSRRVGDVGTSPHIKNLLRRVDENLWGLGRPSVDAPAAAFADSDVTMVGRETIVHEVCELVESNPLVTLRGPGGIGKTRIAREVANVLSNSFTDGCFIVDFAEADRHEDPASLVVRTLGLIPEPYRRPLDTLVDRLSETDRLMILDNCEEFLEELRFLSERINEGCPKVRLLATSRYAIGAAGEVVREVAELDPPDAARLLASLAFPDDQDAQSHVANVKVFELCALLDCIPLAIECAASMVRALGLEDATRALASLPDGAVMPLLDAAHGGRGRHRSIELALNASYRLLSPDEARFFERLSSLRGAFSSQDAGAAVPEPELYDAAAGLRRLVEASLVKQLGADRWRLLEPVRQFAATRLLRRGELAAQAARHGLHFVALAQEAEPNLHGPAEAVWFERLTDTYPNLIKALSWAVESGNSVAALQLTSSLWWYWAAKGMFVNGSAAVERALAMDESGLASPMLRAKGLVALSHLAWWAGNPRRTESSVTEALELIATSDNEEATWLEAWARTGLAGARLWGGGDYRVLKEQLEAGQTLFASIGDWAGLGLNLATHSGVAWHYGDDQLHQTKSWEALKAFDTAGHLTMVALMKRSNGLAKAALGEVEAGRALIEEGIRQSEELGDIGGLPLGLCYLALLEIWAGNRSSAAKALRESIKVNGELGQVWPSLLALALGAEQAALSGRPGDGVKLDAVVQGLTRRTGIRLPPRDRARVELAVESATAMLDLEEAAKIRAEGLRIELPAALRMAADVFE